MCQQRSEAPAKATTAHSQFKVSPRAADAILKSLGASVHVRTSFAAEVSEFVAYNDGYAAGYAQCLRSAVYIAIVAVSAAISIVLMMRFVP